MVNNSVSVIIVNYNSGDMLVKCIEQVLASSVSVKIFISDNASSDHSLALLEKAFPHVNNITIHKNQANLGFSAANNAVFAEISTPYILYLNPDCFIAKDTIEHFIDIMEQHPQAGIAGCLVTNTDGTEQIGCRGLTPTPLRVFNQLFKLSRFFPGQSKYAGYLLSDAPLPTEPVSVELISGSCMFARKKAIDAIGLLDDDYFLYCEDYDWFYRFIQGGWSIIFTPHTAVSHIKSFSTRQIPLKVIGYKAKGMWRYYNKFFKKNASFTTTLLVRTGIVSRLLVLSGLIILKKAWRKMSSGFIKAC